MAKTEEDSILLAPKHRHKASKILHKPIYRLQFLKWKIQVSAVIAADSLNMCKKYTIIHSPRVVSHPVWIPHREVNFRPCRDVNKIKCRKYPCPKFLRHSIYHGEANLLFVLRRHNVAKLVIKGSIEINTPYRVIVDSVELYPNNM